MQFKVRKYFYDVLILGGGGAGLYAAIKAKNQHLRTAIVSKVHPLHSHTSAAQGGINASLGNIAADDWRWHAYDTLQAAAGLADQDMVEQMCQRAPEIIAELEQLGMIFDRTETGKIAQKIYGGQTTEFAAGKFAHRACYAKDQTGHFLMQALYKAALTEHVSFYNHHFVVDLICSQQRCHGVISIDMATGSIQLLQAHNVIIATGGYSQVYYTNTSSAICTGDGIAMAARTGACLQDMEFVQFHPTALYPSGVLITEAARAAGAKLLNSNKDLFMPIYAPKFAELAPRDIVARAIATEIQAGRGAGLYNDYVWLDLTHLSLAYIKQNLPNVVENCLKFAQRDPATELIPVAPAAHYTMGGIATNKSCQVITQGDEVISNLYAIGEAACLSVHGANRLGCNSLLDILVFAEVAVNNIVATKSNIVSSGDQHLKIAANKLARKLQTLFVKTNNLTAELDLDTMQENLTQTMSKYVGIFRSQTELQQAEWRLQEIQDQLQKYRLNDHGLQWNRELQQYLELENMLVCATATVHSALARKESRGAHWRQDYPQLSDDMAQHTIFNYHDSSINYRPVRLEGEVEICHLQDRKY